MRYRILMSYLGAPFCGYQVQENGPSVQGALEDALSMLLRERTGVVGAGRTDAGVNAVNYVASFETSVPVDTEHLCDKLNAVLPKGIAIHGIERAADDFHARFSATARRYKYFIHNAKNPFLDNFSWYCRYELDVDIMNRACGYLVGEHDCSCFEKQGSDNRTSICDIHSAHWDVVTGVDPSLPFLLPPSGQGHLLVFSIEANRFLRNMVRAIVGTLVDIGRGRYAPERIPELLQGGSRGDAGQSVPGHALFFAGVDYEKKRGSRHVPDRG